MSDRADPKHNEEFEDIEKYAGMKRRPVVTGGSADIRSNAEQMELTKSDLIGAKQLFAESKKGRNWDNEEIMIYYEVIKQIGKDFDGIVQVMRKKKVYKNKDQIRNFFFNSIKFLKSNCDINVDELFPNVCRDAKELFFAINSCEWRKRTGGSKYQPERIKELVLEGATTIKANKKNMLIKTPFCPALQRYFTEFRVAQPDKMFDIVLMLCPSTYLDKFFVLSCEQNPQLHLKLSINEKLGRVFEFLKQKWRCSGLQTNAWKDIVLRPARNTEVGKVTFISGDPYGDTVSLCKLEKEQQSIRIQSIERNSKHSTHTATSYNAVINKPFTLNEHILIDGLTEDNVGDVCLSELYSLCGLTTNIELVYSIKRIEADNETWKIFQELINREYGEHLSSAGREDEQTTIQPQISNISATVLSVTQQTIKRNKRLTHENEVIEQPTKRLALSSAKERDDMALFKLQLKNSNLRVNQIRNTRKTKNSNKRSGEPTDFSHLLSESGPIISSQIAEENLIMTQLTHGSTERGFLSNLTESTLFVNDQGERSALCTDSIQGLAHGAMQAILQQDSNQAINSFSDLLKFGTSTHP